MVRRRSDLNCKIFVAAGIIIIFDTICKFSVTGFYELFCIVVVNTTSRSALLYCRLTSFLPLAFMVIDSTTVIMLSKLTKLTE